MLEQFAISASSFHLFRFFFFFFYSFPSLPFFPLLFLSRSIPRDVIYTLVRLVSPKILIDLSSYISVYRLRSWHALVLCLLRLFFFDTNALITIGRTNYYLSFCFFLLQGGVHQNSELTRLFCENTIAVERRETVIAEWSSCKKRQGLSDEERSKVRTWRMLLGGKKKKNFSSIPFAKERNSESWYSRAYSNKSVVENVDDSRLPR